MRWMNEVFFASILERRGKGSIHSCAWLVGCWFLEGHGWFIDRLSDANER